MTSNDLWPPWKTIGIIYSPSATNVLSLKFKQVLLCEISCLQGFTRFSDFESGDLKWPLNCSEKPIGIIYSPRATNVLSLKFNIFHFLKHIMFTKFSYFDLWWNDLWPPWKTIWIIYSPRPTNGYQVWSSSYFYFLRYRVYKPRRTYTHIHTHTHTHTPSPSHRFLRPSARNQKRNFRCQYFSQTNDFGYYIFIAITTSCELNISSAFNYQLSLTLSVFNAEQSSGHRLPRCRSLILLYRLQHIKQHTVYNALR